MDYTTMSTHTPPLTDLENFPVHSLYEALQDLADPRRDQGKRYSLALVLCLIILAKLAGQTTLSGATEWVRHRRMVLVERFGLTRSTMGSAQPMWRRTESIAGTRGKSRSSTSGH